MRLQCPHCHRTGRVPDGTVLPPMVMCPACKQKYEPVQILEESHHEPAAPKDKECHYCGERIMFAAKKCKHCGEIVDPALRAAEEAKAMARERNNQTVVNNNVNAVASSPAVVYLKHREGCVSAFIKWCIIIFIGLVVLGAIIGTVSKQ